MALGEAVGRLGHDSALTGGAGMKGVRSEPCFCKRGREPGLPWRWGV